MLKRYIPFILLLLCAVRVVATQSAQDSLLQALRAAPNDTVRMDLLFRLSDESSNFQEHNTFSQKADSLARMMMQSPNLSARRTGLRARFRALNNYSAYYRQQFNHSQAITEQASALDVSTELNDSVMISNTYVMLGLISYEAARYDDAVMYARKAQAMASAIHEDNTLAAAGVVIGNTYAATSHYADALREYFHSISLRKELVRRAHESKNDSLIQATTGYLTAIYHYVAMLYRRQGDYDRAIELAKQSLALNTEVGNKSGIISEFLNIADVYTDNLRKYDSAMVYLDKLYLFAQAVNNVWAVSTVLERKGYIFLALGDHQRSLKVQLEGLQLAFDIGDLKGIADGYFDIAVVYEAMGASSRPFYDSAVVYLKKALHDYSELKGETLQISTYVAIAQVLRKQGKIQAAKSYLLKALPGLRSTRRRRELRDVFQSLSQCDSALGKYASAYQYLQQCMLYADSVNKELSDKEYQRVQFHADLESIEQAMAREQESKDAVARQELDRQKNIRNGVLAGASLLSAFFFVVVRQRNRIKREKVISEQERERSDELLRNILPTETAQELKSTGTAVARSYDQVTVLFTDFKDFTRVSEHLRPEELVEEINHCYSAFDAIITKYGIEKIKTIGDSYMCAGGLPVASTTHAIDVVRAACAIREFMLQEQRERSAAGKFYFECRIGVHTGPVVAGIVGIKKFAYDIWGDTVNVASRMQSSGEEGKVNISEATYAMVKDQVRCSYRGMIPIKNRGEIGCYFVE